MGRRVVSLLLMSKKTEEFFKKIIVGMRRFTYENKLIGLVLKIA